MGRGPCVGILVKQRIANRAGLRRSYPGKYLSLQLLCSAWKNTGANMEERKSKGLGSCPEQLGSTLSVPGLGCFAVAHRHLHVLVTGLHSVESQAKLISDRVYSPN